MISMGSAKGTSERAYNAAVRLKPDTTTPVPRTLAPLTRRFRQVEDSERLLG